MRKLKVYLDTSVLNFPFADDAPEFKKITIEFFNDYVQKNIYDTFISEVVIKEIMNTKNKDKRNKLLNSLKDYPFEVLNINDEVEALASIYVEEGIIPQNKFEDAEHIAISTVNQMDILLSWNFKHLVNYNKKQQVRTINSKENYLYPLDLLTPLELIYENN
ncbi:MAG: type II toxin-antitoxin system VapC family toxin [bacterium]